MARLLPSWPPVMVTKSATYKKCWTAEFMEGPRALRYVYSLHQGYNPPSTFRLCGQFAWAIACGMEGTEWRSPYQHTLTNWLLIMDGLASQAKHCERPSPFAA